MNRTALLSTMLLVLGLAVAVGAQARVPDAERVPITDPATLEHLGFAPDAENVFWWARAPVEEPPREPAGFAVVAGEPIGNQYTSWAGFEFFPLVDTYEYAKGPSFLIYNGALVSMTDGGIFEAQIGLPHGALWRYLDIVGWHDHASEQLVVTAFERCLPFFGGGNPSETVLGSETYGDADGALWEDLFMANLRVDNSECTYHLRARFGTAGGASAGLTIQLTKVRAEWRPREIFADGFESGDVSAWIVSL